MDGILSQEEISALLNDTGSENATQNTSLTDNEKDAIGEIANISMGTAATTLFSLVNRKVEISTPVVSLATWDDIVEAYERPCVFIRIAYTVGLDGNNLLILKENDVKIITDLMMGGDGTNTDGELGELHLSAICEAMNQMMGSAATSLSSMLNKTIDISPPHADLIDLQENVDEGTIDEFLKNPFVKISFKMEIGDLVNSTIMQLYPISFAKEMCESMTQNMEQDAAANATSGNTTAEGKTGTTADTAACSTADNAESGDDGSGNARSANDGRPDAGTADDGSTNDEPANDGVSRSMYSRHSSSHLWGNRPLHSRPENIDLIMDVPLEVTVELGRTSKSIKEILDFAPGTIIELNKIAGEPIDVLVNGKYVAKGEVVIIEESFGVRITEIIK